MTIHQRTPLSGEVMVDEVALATGCDVSRRALPRETGGILVGWREGGGVVVREFLLVDDAQAHNSTYERRHATAQVVLERYLARTSDERVGYVGEWHSHPRPQPPSPQDNKSLRAAARLSPAQIALVVFAVDPSLDTVTPHGVIASRNTFRRIGLDDAAVRLRTDFNPPTEERT